MSKADNKPGSEPIGPDDPLSATGMFLGSFRQEPDVFQIEEQAPSAAAKPAGAGEFTQMFGAVTPAPPVSGEATRIFGAAPTPVTAQSPSGSSAASPPRMKGFSSPGASDSASAEGSFTQLFRTPPTPSPRPPQVPPPQARPVTFDLGTSGKQSNPTQGSMGVTDLFRALSPTGESEVDRDMGRPQSFSNTRPPAPAGVPADSFTVLIQRLTEHTPTPTLETQQMAPPPAAPSAQGEYTRIISREEAKAAAAPPAPAPHVAAEATLQAPIPKVQVPAIQPLKAVPKLAAPAVSPPKTKLQEMVPILLVLNGFLMVVVIIVMVFVLMRR